MTTSLLQARPGGAELPVFAAPYAPPDPYLLAPALLAAGSRGEAGRGPVSIAVAAA